MAALLLHLGAIGCALRSGTGGPFPDVARAEAELVRGRSTRADVERILGRPNGPGSALFPTQTGSPRDVWFYVDMVVAVDLEFTEEDMPTRATAQYVLVFFQGDVFDGMMWWPAEMTGSLGSQGTR